MATYGDYIRIGTLATLANADDRHAFDSLLEIANGKSKESSNPDFVHLADSTVGSIISVKEGGLKMTRTFTQPQTPDSMKRFMRSPNPFERLTALDNYPQDDKSILPILVEMIRTDNSLDVVVRAVGRFNSLTKQFFHFYQTTELLSWWANNQKSFQ